MKKNTFKVMFVIRRNQVNRDGKCSITIRITVIKCRYCSILACLCFGCSFFYDYDEYRLIVNALMSAAVIFLFQYLKYRKQSNIRE